MEMQYPGVVNAVFGQPWAITPEAYAVICDVVRSRALGVRLTAEEIQERIEAQTGISSRHVGTGVARNGAVAVLPLYGIISQRMNMITQASGGTSTELFGKALKQALAEPAVSAIVLDVDSPGGGVYGVGELASEIQAARGTKPIIAVANSMAGSAAYWIAAQADELVIMPGGEVGSIGVIGAHQDISEAQKRAGITTTLISAGRFKAEGSPFGPLSDEARAALQASADRYYEMFVRAVAQGRRVSMAAVRDGFGEGRLVQAEDALKWGMVDTIGTMDQTIARLMGRGPRGKASAMADVELRQRRMRMAGS